MMAKQINLFKIIWISFIAGFLATLVFHQGFLEILFQLHWVAKKPFSMVATVPFGIPASISLAFWGGVWGVVGLMLLKRYLSDKKFYLLFILFGGIFPPFVAMMVVFPLKGISIVSFLNPMSIGMMFLINALWGYGSALFIKVMLRIIHYIDF